MKRRGDPVGREAVVLRAEDDAALDRALARADVYRVLAVAFRDPTHVNFITEETFPMYFDDQLRWAAIYGFEGAFSVRIHEWRGPHIFAVLQKVPVPEAEVQ